MGIILSCFKRHNLIASKEYIWVESTDEEDDFIYYKNSNKLHNSTNLYHYNYLKKY